MYSPIAVPAEVVIAVVGARDGPAAEDAARLEDPIAGLEVAVNDVAARVVSEVVGLEARRDGPEGGVEDDVAFLLVDVEARRPAGERCGALVDLDPVGVGPLEIMEGRELERRDGFGAAADLGQAGPAGQRPTPAPIEEGPAVDAEGEGAPAEGRLEVPLPEVPRDRRGDEAEAAPPLPELLEAPGDAVMAEGLDLDRRTGAVDVDAGVLALGQGADDAQVEIAADLAGHLGRGQDGRPVGRIEESRAAGRTLGRAADAAAVEDLGIVPAEGTVDVGAAPAEVEDARAFDEEGPLLLIIGLLVGDVDDGRIDLDLAEIGIDREVEGQIAAQPALEVEAAAGAEIAAGAEGVARLPGVEIGLRQAEGRDLEPAARGDARKPGELGEVRDETAFLLGDPGEMALFVLALDDPLEIDAPEIGVAPLEAELVEGDAHFDGPAEAVDPGGALPDAVPGRVELLVVGEGAVLDGAGRIDTEIVAAPAVVIGIEADVEQVGFGRLVAPPEAAGDPGGLGVEEAGGDVDVVAVESHPDGRRFGGGLPVRRVALGEAARARRLPDAFGEDAVDGDGPGHGDRGDRPDGARVVGTRSFLARSGPGGECLRRGGRGSGRRQSD